MLRTGDTIKQNIRFRETCCVGEGWNSLTPSKFAKVLTFWRLFQRVRKHAGTLDVLVFSCFLQSPRLYEQILGSIADTAASTQIHLVHHLSESLWYEGLEPKGSTDKEVASYVRRLVGSANSEYSSR